MGTDKKSTGSSVSVVKEIILVIAFVAILVIAIIIGIGLLNQSTLDPNSNLLNENDIVTKLDEKNNERLNRYIEEYKDKTMGYVGYILNRISIYSIPLCLLLFIVGAFLRYLVGQEKYIENERGYGMIVGSVIFFAIAQIAPLVFAIIVTFGRG